MKDEIERVKTTFSILYHNQDCIPLAPCSTCLVLHRRQDEDVMQKRAGSRQSATSNALLRG